MVELIIRKRKKEKEKDEMESKGKKKKCDTRLEKNLEIETIRDKEHSSLTREAACLRYF